MPIIPLGQAQYNNEENRNLIDTYNDNFRQLDWLLNKIKLDSENIQSEIELNQQQINQLMQDLINKIQQDTLTEAFLKSSQEELRKYVEAIEDSSFAKLNQVQKLMAESLKQVDGLVLQATIRKAELEQLLSQITTSTNPLYQLIQQLQNGTFDTLSPIQKENLSSLNEILTKGMFDTLGMNAKYLKFYPNRIFNSSFECFDEVTKKPFYWTTNGTLSMDALYDNSYSLKLSPNQSAKQKEENGKGLMNASWWSDWSERTRISFRAKTTSASNGQNGKVTIKCRSVSSNQFLLGYYWLGDEEYWSYQAELEVSLDWIDGLVSVAFYHPKSMGVQKMEIEIINTGLFDIFIDAIQGEPDFTGKWSSFYTDGLESTPTMTGIADNSIETKHIKDNAVTEVKLDSALRTKINNATSNSVARFG